MSLDEVAEEVEPTRQEQLERRIDGLRSQRLKVAARQRRAEAERATAAADMEEEAGKAEARRQRLRAPLEQAERRASVAADWEEKDAAQAAWEVARGTLADFEVEVGEELARRKREYADLDARVGALIAEATELDRQSATVTEELGRLVGDRQARRAEDLEAQLAQLAPIVEAQREAVGITATADLSDDYAKQAHRHGTAWKWWGVALVLAIAAAIGGGLFLFHDDTLPDGELTNGVVVEITRNLFVVGLLIYAVRLASLQFRVHRHLEAVAQNKATALSTFNRIVVIATEPEIRNSLATVLAQSVFSSDETGFIDATGDHVTLIERVVGSLPRPG